MNQIRLLPLVMVAVAGLLLVKVIGVVSGQGFVLGGSQIVQAQESVPEGDTPSEGEGEQAETGEGEEAVDPAVQKAADEEAAAAEAADQIFRDAPEDLSDFQAETTERVLLTRLADRRSALNQRESELEMRQDLIEAAEKRVEERFAMLQTLEDKIGVSLKLKEEEESAQFKSLVSMYELMKPAEAAVIFNRLNMDILVRVVRGMKARKMAGVLAKMTTDRAEELTIKLANYNPERQLAGGIDDLNALPQIVGE